MIQKILKFCNENHLFVIATVTCILATIYLIGCQSQVPSILHPGTKVTRDELSAEVDAFIATLDARTADLDRQDAIKQTLLDKAAIFATTGTVNWQGLLNTAISVAAVSSALDQRRRYKVTKQQLTDKINGTT